MRIFVARWIVVAWLVAGCSVIPEASVSEASISEASLQPRPCTDVYSKQRCLAMTDAAASVVGLTRRDVTATAIVPDPPPKDGVMVILGGAAPINVRITVTDGTTRDTPMCMGLASGPTCTDTPKLEARSGFADGAGYKDVPCPDDAPPNTCGRPLPTLEPAAVAAARPLSIVRSSIPIDHVGAYEVSLGKASLPNGVVSVASFEFADTWPADVSLEDGVAQIELRSLEPGGKPFQNYYEHGWRPGVERVEAVLTFRVLWFEKGAVLNIRDVVVE